MPRADTVQDVVSDILAGCARPRVSYPGVAMTDATRANVALLAFCQALSMTGLNVLVTTSSLVGYSLLEDKAFATLPMICERRRW